MKFEIYWRAFGTLLLISECHSARLSGSLVNGSESELITEVDRNSTNDEVGDGIMSSIGERAGRCLQTLKRWIGFSDDDLEGNPKDVRFYLYPSPVEKNHAQEIVFGDVGSLQQSNFGVGLPLKIVIHGFTKSYDSEAVQIIKNAYLAHMFEDPTNANNIILVDWEPIANPNISLELVSYKYAVANVNLVGKRIGEFIQFLMQNGAVKRLREVHIIGFSLGAHIAGAAGNTLRQLNAGEPPMRVTGLDPAGPAFYQGLRFSHRSLHKTDGRFVDVIHTSMGVYGTLETIGHADFYPNGGGPIQERCEVEHDEELRQEPHEHNSTFTRLAEISSCSHGKAPEFFAMSILHPNKIGCRCESYWAFKTGCQCTETAILGEYCDPRSRGKFYLDI